MARAIDDIDIETPVAVAVIPTWPQKCMRFECDNDTAIAFFRVRNSNGRLLSGYFSQYANVNKFNNTEKIKMRPGFTFDSWVTRCTKCYWDELIESKRNVSFHNTTTNQLRI